MTTDLLANGYARLDQALPEHVLTALVEDAESYEFLPPGRNGGGEFAMGSMQDAAPSLFAEWLQGACSLPEFVPNEVSYQRYEAGVSGLRIHRDERYYVECIAIATLRGMTTFGVHDSEPPRPVRAEWTTRPRDVILLQGWLALPVPDPRPFHRVDAPSTRARLMVQLRMNIAASDRLREAAAVLTAEEIEQSKTTAAFRQTPRRR